MNHLLTEDDLIDPSLKKLFTHSENTRSSPHPCTCQALLCLALQTHQLSSLFVKVQSYLALKSMTFCR